ncbi:MAG: hypothetical protein ACMG6S_06270, partial [Byssovorax sp.]
TGTGTGTGTTMQSGICTHDITKLDEVRSRKAVAYACWGDDLFPPWLEICAKSKPALVLEVFAPVLRAEYEAKADGRLFSKLALAPEAVRVVCAPLIVHLLKSSEPQCVQVLATALKIMYGLGPLINDLCAMCRSQCIATVNAPERFALWWRAWMAQDAPASAFFLRDYVSVRSPRDTADACVLACVPERQSDDLLAPLRGHADGLLVLLDVVLRHVRPDEDTAEVHDRRREAQEFRWQLLNAVIETGAPIALRTLDNLATMPWGSAWWTDLFKHAADECATNSGARRWSLDDALCFLDQGSLVPQTSGELFDVVVGVFDDVRQYIACGDDSPRAAYDRDDQDEVQFQILMLGCLAQRANGRYSVARESELADAKRPDLRIWAKELGPVSVEIKVVEKGWSLQDLEDAIEKQLVGQYMKDAAARYGVLVLISAGKPRERWEKAGTSITSFSSLVKHLTMLAADVRRRQPQIEGLAVVGIDFHEPSMSKASPKRATPTASRRGK